MEQYNFKQQQFQDSQQTQQGFWGKTMSMMQNKKGMVSEQLKIEYMLRYFCKNYVASSFPYIPLWFFKDLMINRAEMNIAKDEKSYKKLFAHFQTMADTIMNQQSFKNATVEGMRKTEYFDKINPSGEFVNLKEVRD
jgi:hypothetical protein